MLGGSVLTSCGVWRPGRPSPPHPYCSRPGTWSILPPTKQNPYRDNGDAHTDNIHHSPPQTTPPTPTRKYEVLQLRHSHTRTRILCCLTSLVSYRQTFHVSILTLDIWDGMYSMQYYGQRARGGSYGVHERCLLPNSKH